MIRAFRLYTGSDNASHVVEGTIDETDRQKLSPSISKKRQRIHRTTGTLIRSPSS